MVIFVKFGVRLTPLLFIPVYQIDGFFHGVDIDDAEDGAKDLLLVGVHVRGHVGDDGGAHKVAVRIICHLCTKMISISPL